MPAGSVSLTVVVPLELDGPALLTVIWYMPVPPAVNVPSADFVVVRLKVVASGGVVGFVTGPLF